MPLYDKASSYGSGSYSLVKTATLSPAHQPMTADGATLFCALQMTGSSEYQVNLRLAAGEALCPGKYRYSATIMYDAAFNGRKLALHSRFYYVGGGAIAFGTEGDAALKMNAFPSQSDVFEEVEVFYNLAKPVQRADFYIGYQAGSYSGNMYVTDVKLQRWDSLATVSFADRAKCKAAGV